MNNITLPNKPSAYSYIRMSTDVQLKGDSRRRQLELSQRYAAEHGLELVEEFKLEDIGVSAFKGANVTTGALGRFLTAIKEGQIPRGAYLLVESLDRISRQDVTKALTVFMDILNSGVNIVTLADNQAYMAGKTEPQQLIFSIFIMSRAHEESQMKSHRLSSAWINKRRNVGTRKLTAQCPGWLRLSNDKMTFEIIEERAAIVRSIFEDSASGIGAYSITRRLNEAQIKPFGRSKGWQTSYIIKTLNNRAVIGEFQPHRLVDGERILEGDPLEGYFPSIIEKDLFYRAQASISQRRVTGGGRRGEFISNLFSGLAKCAYCGGRMHFANKGPGPKGGTYLVCDSSRRGMGCEKTQWRYDHFETSFLGFVQELDLEPLLRSEDEHLKRAALDDAINALKGRKHELEQRRDRTFILIDQPGADMAYLGEKLRECGLELAGVTRQLEQKEAEQSELRSDVSRFYESKEQIKSLVTRLQQRDSDEIYKLRSQIAARLRSLVSALIVAPSGTAPLTRQVIEQAKASEEAPLLAEVVQQLRRDLEDPSEHRRYFYVVFKDGSQRGVYPAPDDPLKFEEQVFRSDRGHHRLKSDGSDTLFAPNEAAQDHHAKEKAQRWADLIAAETSFIPSQT